MMINVVKYLHEYFVRDRCFTPPTFEFKFDFEIPSPRNWRIIAERDELGRILFAKVFKIAL